VETGKSWWDPPSFRHFVTCESFMIVRCHLFHFVS
jgi:hypothetical protein